MSDNEKKVTEEAEMPKDKKKKKKVLAILLPILAVFLALVIAVVAFVAHKFSLIQFDDNESTTINPTQEFIEDDDGKLDFAEMDDATGNDFREILKNWATNGGEKMSNRDIINVLLIGSDASAEEAGRANITEKGNTDVMMLVSINQIEKKIKLISKQLDFLFLLY